MPLNPVLKKRLLQDRQYLMITENLITRVEPGLVLKDG